MWDMKPCYFPDMPTFFIEIVSLIDRVVTIC